MTIDCNENRSQALIDAVVSATLNGGGTIKLAERCTYRFMSPYADPNTPPHLNALHPIMSNVTMFGDDSTLISSSQHSITPRWSSGCSASRGAAASS